MSTPRHIILIGFKNAGKSTIGKRLAQLLNRPFVDLDDKIEYLFQQKYKKACRCREIMQIYGADFFRELETTALAETIAGPPHVIALGGGTPMRIENQRMIASQCLIHITAEPKIIFKRIMKGRRPAFFPPGVDSRLTFNKIWEERDKVYHQLTSVRVQNSGKIEDTVQQLFEMHPWLGNV
ncbi:MAG: aroK [Gammaproteobacteria bacterium]|nr:aroK [Gammaproteobacteria bacterium]